MGLMDKFADPALFESLSFGEKMTGSFITMLMGLGVTFLILCLLWAFVAIMGKIMGVASKGDKASAKTEAAAAPSAPITVPAVQSDDEIIAAVIAAAVAAYQGSGGTSNLVVRKISRISGETTLWTNAAREDCIASRKF